MVTGVGVGRGVVGGGGEEGIGLMQCNFFSMGNWQTFKKGHNSWYSNKRLLNGSSVLTFFILMPHHKVGHLVQCHPDSSSSISSRLPDSVLYAVLL